MESFQELKINKFDKTVLQRLSRLTKSFIHKLDGGAYHQVCIREELARSLQFYINHRPTFINIPESLYGYGFIPFFEVIHWNEDVSGQAANVKVDAFTADVLKALSHNASLEGNYLTIDNCDFGSITECDLLGNYALGAFLAYLAELYRAQCGTVEICSGTFERFIDRGDCIIVRLYLVNSRSDDFFIQSCMSDGNIQLKSFRSFDFLFINGTVQVTESTSTKNLNRFSCREGNFFDKHVEERDELDVNCFDVDR